MRRAHELLLAFAALAALAAVPALAAVKSIAADEPQRWVPGAAVSVRWESEGEGAALPVQVTLRPAALPGPGNPVPGSPFAGRSARWTLDPETPPGEYVVSARGAPASSAPRSASVLVVGATRAAAPTTAAAWNASLSRDGQVLLLAPPRGAPALPAPGEARCDALLPEADRDVGPDARCEWTAAGFSARLGPAAAGSELARSGRVLVRGAPAPAPVALPSDPEPPAVSLEAPAEASTCERARVRLRDARSGGAAAFRAIRWSAARGLTPSGLGPADREVSLSPTAGAPIEVSAEAETLAGGRATARETIRVLAAGTSGYIDLGPAGLVRGRADADLAVRGLVRGACGGPAEPLDLSWSIDGRPLPGPASPSVLLRAGTLAPGRHALSASRGNLSASLVLEIEAAPLALEVSVARAADGVDLVASLPEREGAGAATVAWTVSRRGPDPSNATFAARGARIRVPAAVLAAGAEHVAVARAVRDSDGASAERSVSFRAPGNASAPNATAAAGAAQPATIRVSVRAPARAPRSGPLVLSAEAEPEAAAGPVEVSWIAEALGGDADAAPRPVALEPGNGLLLSRSARLRSISVEASALRPGSRYRFTARAAAAARVPAGSRAEGEASVEVETPAPPPAGASVSVEPLEGEAGSTPFTFSASGWPAGLEFRFGVRRPGEGEGDALLTDWRPSALARATIPAPREGLAPYVEAREPGADAPLARAYGPATLAVRRPAGGGRFDARDPDLARAAALLDGERANATEKLEVARRLREGAARARTDSEVEALAEAARRAADEARRGNATRAEREGVASEIVRGIRDLARAAEAPPERAVSEMLRAIAASGGDAKPREKEEAIAAVAGGVVRGLVQGAPPTVVGAPLANASIAAVLDAPEALAGASVGGVLVPSNATGIFAGQGAVAITVATFDASPYPGEVVGPVVEATVSDASGAPIPVAGLDPADPFAISLGAAPAAAGVAAPECVYYDSATGAWLSDGCTTSVSVATGEVLCLCTHLTAFGVREASPSASDPTPTPNPTSSDPTPGPSPTPEAPATSVDLPAPAYIGGLAALAVAVLGGGLWWYAARGSGGGKRSDRAPPARGSSRRTAASIV